METKKALVVFMVILYCLQTEARVGTLLCLPLQKCNNNESDQIARYSVSNVMRYGKDVALNALGNAPDLLPSATDIFTAGKQAVLGIPFAAAFKAIHVFCSEALTSNGVQPKYTPDIKKMKFQLLTNCKRELIPLQDPGSLLKLPNFDVNKKVVIFVTGWTTNANKSVNAKWLAKAYRCRGDTNFILLDAAHFVDTLYSWAAFNTDEIGRFVAESLNILTKYVPVENIHLIGHSLGAHIVGAAGRYFTHLSEKTIPRITGLDPANPCFNEGESLSGLMRGDAEFVDVIHSNSNALGKRDPLGDADFYPGGIVILPPGCLTIDCAHDRAWEYYVESVYPGNERNFMATRCTSLKSLSQGNCQAAAVPMGFAFARNAKGNFILRVNDESPFGENGDKKRTMKHEKCGFC